MSKSNRNKISGFRNIIWIYLLLSVFLNLISGLSGYMANTVKAIGHRSEHLDKYQSFIITGDKLIVQYTVDIEATCRASCSRSFHVDHFIAESVQRWGQLDLNSGWGPPEIQKEAAWWWGDFGVSLVPSEGQAPQLKSNNYVQLQPSEKAWYHQIRNKKIINSIEQTIQQQVEECLDDTTYCINFPYGYASNQFVILKNEDPTELVQCKTVAVRTIDYYENWAKYVHYVLLPFAFIFDVIALPLTLTVFLCM